MSIASHLAERPDPRHKVEFLYSTRDPGQGQSDASKVLFLERLAEIFGGGGALKGRLSLFLTAGGEGKGEEVLEEGSGDDRLGIAFKRRRITIEDIAHAIGDDKRFAAVYVCGVPTMTDDFVEKLTSPKGLGLEPHRVLYEKWW
jgi:NAD(P)H-flavin reductase